jgi:hypothetical protein
MWCKISMGGARLCARLMSAWKVRFWTFGGRGLRATKREAEQGLWLKTGSHESDVVGLALPSDLLQDARLLSFIEGSG